MKRAAVLLILVLALTANLVLPRTVWRIGTCCHQTLSMVAPERLDFCVSNPIPATPNALPVLKAPNCCQANPITLSVELTSSLAPDLHQDLPALTPDISLPPVLSAPVLDRHPEHPTTAWLPTGPPSGFAPAVYLVHSRLNL